MICDSVQLIVYLGLKCRGFAYKKKLPAKTDSL